MWSTFKRVLVAGLILWVTVSSRSSHAANTNESPASKPVFSRIHTVSIHVRDLETFNEAFHLLSEDLKLPKKWGQKWTPQHEAERMYAGFWAGNMCIEPCGPYDTDRFEGESKAMFFALTFLPSESSAASAKVLDMRGLAHNGQKAFLSLVDPHLSSASCGVCIMDLGHESRLKDSEREAELHEELTVSQGGTLGLIGIDEIHVQYTCDEGLERWKRLFEPQSLSEESSVRLGKGPAIRFLKGPRVGLAGLVLKVSSLSKAKEFLKEKVLDLTISLREE